MSLISGGVASSRRKHIYEVMAARRSPVSPNDTKKNARNRSNETLSDFRRIFNGTENCLQPIWCNS